MAHLKNKINQIFSGFQPDNGLMTWEASNQDLAGFPGDGRLIIRYNFKEGTQGPHHPEPGAPFRLEAFPRVAFLPNNQEGRNILRYENIEVFVIS